MSNLEHLIENALVEQQEMLLKHKSYESARNDFVTDKLQKEMAEMEGISVEAVWEMAYYVTDTWCENKIQQFIKDKYNIE